MPQMALTPFGLPSLATNHTKHSRIKVSDASPSGILNHSLDPHHNKQIDMIFNMKLKCSCKHNTYKQVAAIDR